MPYISGTPIKSPAPAMEGSFRISLNFLKLLRISPFGEISVIKYRRIDDIRRT